jgi:hypothetical protein
MTAVVTSAYGTLDVTDDRQVTDYERHFYDAYAGPAGPRAATARS